MVMDIRSLAPGHASLAKSEKSRKKSATAEASDDAANESDDSVSLTGKASQISRLVQQMKAAPAVDASRIIPVKGKIDNGDYEIEYERVANKMLDFESSYQGY